MKTIRIFLIAMLVTFCGTANAQSKAEFQAVLEEFCQSYYNEGFSDRQYIEGSLVVKTVEVDEVTEVIKLKGKHSYRGQYYPIAGRKTHSDVDFKAEVSEARNGLRIKFWKWYEPDIMNPRGFWEGPIEHVIIP